MGKRLNNNKRSDVKYHCLLPFNDFNLLNYECHKFKRLIKESILLVKYKPLLKKRTTRNRTLSFQLHLHYFIMVYLIDIFSTEMLT